VHPPTGRPVFYCSPIQKFCLMPDQPPGNLASPPLWTLLIYMLQIETLHVTLRENLQLPAPPTQPQPTWRSSQMSSQLTLTIQVQKGIPPNLNPDWRWEDQEAVQRACPTIPESVSYRLYITYPLSLRTRSSHEYCLGIRAVNKNSTEDDFPS
jgi:hypothetical protein